MAEVILNIPIKVDSRLGLNKQYSGKHWTVRDKEAKEIHSAVKIALAGSNVNAILLKPVEITFRYNSRLDCDNHGYLNKLLIDGLKGHLIVDDDKRYVKRIITEFQSESKDIIMIIKEIE